MRVVHKFPLTRERVSTVNVKEGAEFLHVDIQRGVFCLWYLLDPSQVTVEKSIVIVGTGDQIHSRPGALKFLGTVMDGEFVWHFFEMLP